MLFIGLHFFLRFFSHYRRTTIHLYPVVMIMPLEVVAMFVDLRGSSQIGEQHLPYVVLFILNQFFVEMSDALDDSFGHYAQFAGDGLMVLYGLKRGLETGCDDVVQHSNADFSAFPRQTVSLRGKQQSVLVYAIKEPLNINLAAT